MRLGFIEYSSDSTGPMDTETIHVLRCAEDDGKFGESAFTGFVYRLRQLPITFDAVNPAGVQLAVASISREFKISGYDAQYL